MTMKTEKWIPIDCKIFEVVRINGDEKEKTGTNMKMRRNGKFFGMVQKMCGTNPSSKIPKFQNSQVAKLPSCQVAKLPSSQVPKFQVPKFPSSQVPSLNQSINQSSIIHQSSIILGATERLSDGPTDTNYDHRHQTGTRVEASPSGMA